jgi:hypothetical protein
MSNVALLEEFGNAVPDSADPNGVQGNSKTNRCQRPCRSKGFTCFCDQDAAPFFIVASCSVVAASAV